jgi:TPR repeat protein
MAWKNCIKGLAAYVLLTLFSPGTTALAGPDQGASQYIDGVDAAINGNYRSAYTNWISLAKRGDARAQFNLALLYHAGLYVQFNEQQAIFWYRKAAENGIREAQEYLAVGYKEGWFGLPVNEKKASYWQDKLEQSAYPYQ